MTAQPEITFMVDHMLIKLGKYLRILGHDAEWNKARRTHELIRRANREGRVFITRNTRLPDQYPAPDRVMVLSGTDPVDQLWEVVAEFGIKPEQFLFSRCIRCNVLLDEVSDKNEVAGSVDPNVLARYNLFHRCPRCGTVFWKGSHVSNTCRKLRITASPAPTGNMT